MDKINNSELRTGNFTNSEIIALLAEPTAAAKKQGVIFGKPALTYINQCNMERRHGLPLELDISAPPLNWGKICEVYVHRHILPLEYKYSSDETILHPDYDFWAGSPDGGKYDEGKTVTDIKCPMTRQSFSQLVDGLYEGPGKMVNDLAKIWDWLLAVREEHTNGEKYYTQLVGNSIITRSKFAEMLVFMPYKHELTIIREMAQELYDKGLKQFHYIANAEDSQLPHIKDKGYYANINIIRFEVPKSDKELLTNRVLEASKLLIPRI